MSSSWEEPRTSQTPGDWAVESYDRHRAAKQYPHGGSCGAERLARKLQDKAKIPQRTMREALSAFAEVSDKHTAHDLYNRRLDAATEAILSFQTWQCRQHQYLRGIPLDAPAVLTSICPACPGVLAPQVGDKDAPISSAILSEAYRIIGNASFKCSNCLQITQETGLRSGLQSMCISLRGRVRRALCDNVTQATRFMKDLGLSKKKRHELYRLLSQLHEPGSIFPLNVVTLDGGEEVVQMRFAETLSEGEARVSEQLSHGGTVGYSLPSVYLGFSPTDMDYEMSESDAVSTTSSRTLGAST